MPASVKGVTSASYPLCPQRWICTLSRLALVLRHLYGVGVISVDAVSLLPILFIIVRSTS
ncbi:MAG: hypothetical protein ACLUFM_03020 [Lachnospiraceae bacterium]